MGGVVDRQGQGSKGVCHTHISASKGTVFTRELTAALFVVELRCLEPPLPSLTISLSRSLAPSCALSFSLSERVLCGAHSQLNENVRGRWVGGRICSGVRATNSRAKRSAPQCNPTVPCNRFF